MGRERADGAASVAVLDASGPTSADQRTRADPREMTQPAARGAQPEMEPEDGMPGTPPFDEQSVQSWPQEEQAVALKALASTRAAALGSTPAMAEESSTPASLKKKARAASAVVIINEDEFLPETRAARARAATLLRRAARCFLCRLRLAKHLSAVGRPVELKVAQVRNVEMLCDYRDVVSVHCNVRVLKKPFGPFMFHFSTSKATNPNLPTWDDRFFVPMLSSKCDIVVTLVGVTVSNRQRFLGQAVAAMTTGWEHSTTFSAPLGKWKFPVDEPLVGLHRFITGTVELEITPVSSRLPCKSGQFLLAPPTLARPTRSFSFWTRQINYGPMASPQTPHNPLTPSPSRKKVVTRWGVLTDTFFHLFDDKKAKLLLSLDLAKIQLVKASGSGQAPAQASGDLSRLFPVKIYCHGTLYALYVSSRAQQLAWEYRIDLHRRQLLIP